MDRIVGIDSSGQCYTKEDACMYGSFAFNTAESIEAPCSVNVKGLIDECLRPVQWSIDLKAKI
jgi:hypothetical protein